MKLQHSANPAIEETFTSMQSRMMDGMNSLIYLSGSPPSEHDCSRDLAALFRVMYDLHVQFRYILLDPAKLCAAYRNFAHIEQYKQFQLLKSGSLYHNALKVNPQLALNNASIDKNYHTHKSAYQSKDKTGTTRLWAHWYAGNLVGLAHKIDDRTKTKTLEKECQVVQNVFSASVHSSSLALIKKPIGNNEVLSCGSAITMRVIGEIAESQKAMFTKEEATIYSLSMLPFFS
jgi:hypothetical protein